jgi:hypothetical protein
MDNKWEINGLDNSNFHSSRKERHELGGVDGNKIKKGFFQKNPSFKIVIIDLLFIIIISGVIVPFIYKREGTLKIDNYRMTLKAFDYDDQAMVTLTVRETDGLDSGGLVEADFYLDKDSLHASESDILPGSGEERILKAKLSSNNEIYIFCNITINGKNKTIKKKIK